MDDLIKKLIIRIIQESRASGIRPGVTRVTKLLYLIEWDYFAWQRKRPTELDWVFLHYGPWSPQLSNILRDEYETPEEKEQGRVFREVFWSPPQFDKVDTRLAMELEASVQRVFNTFGSIPTSEIVRYVYFNTEPMQHAQRKQRLVFEKTRKPTKPFNPVGALSKETRHSLRERMQAATKAKLAEKRETFGDVSPELIQVFSQLDYSDFDLPDGEIRIDDEVRQSIMEEY